MASAEATASVAAAAVATKKLPSLSRQKSTIAESGDILNHDTRVTILRIVMMEVGESAMIEGPDGPVKVPVVLKNQSSREVSINVDNIPNEEVIAQLYNLVTNRRAALSEPAGK